MLSDRVVKKEVAIGLIGLFVCILLAALVAVGYKFYTINNARLPQLTKDEIALKTKSTDNPDDIKTHLNLGQVYYLQNKRDRALQEYRAALKHDANNVEARYYIGLISKDNLNYKEAELQMKKVLQMDPKYQGASLTLARIYFLTKQYEKAVNQYQYTVKNYPPSADVLTELGKVYEVRGNTDASMRMFREALQYVPGYKPAIDEIERLNGTKKGR